ncbi:ankyrin repeat domain-containing protein 33B [Brienomyrus brachyistius]|uniref:ankyrin repeat domain-containing protein 33B n=1 Tax=Brienomyrus brachyistius TaxID=42636 RepID=UPI0020B36C4E|nr:ankyrin repeat domain-containing protein 33B [Brienomyrus brachyistius]
MMLITDHRDRGRSSSIKLKHISQIKYGDVLVHPAPVERSASLSEEDDHPSYSESGEDYEEFDDFSEIPDTRSIASDDSFYPMEDELAGAGTWPHAECSAAPSFFQACSTNNAVGIKIMIRQGVAEEEVMKTDKNNRTGLLVACYQGYDDVIVALAQCPFVDVNWQDNEGNTALITACQAGHITICNYLLNYYPGLDLEHKNCHGFTALMKAAIQGRTECVRTLMFAGADLGAHDPGRKLTSLEWAVFTGRHETAWLMTRLLARPCPEQFSESYRLEWPLLPDLVAKAKKQKGCLRKMTEAIRNSFFFRTHGEPQEDGVMDHMVRLTTGIGSPFVATACQTVCPSSPPRVGKRHYSVQEILKKQRAEQLRNLGSEHLDSYKKLFQNSQVTLVPRKKERRASLQPQDPAGGGAVALRRSSLLPLHLVRRRSVRPGMAVPKVRVTKAPAPLYVPEKEQQKNGTVNEKLLQIPKWRYKELREERKKMDEAERKKREALPEKKRTSAWRRT